MKLTTLGHPVFNDLDERLGTVDDIIIAPDKAILTRSQRGRFPP
jgi:hypothetical protein